MEEAASSSAAASGTPFQLQFDKPIPFQVSSRLVSLPSLASRNAAREFASINGA